jgi:hypothetical protein
MFSVRQPYPMLMAARRRLDDGEFEKLLRATVVVAFRYNVIGAQLPGEQERVYHAAATAISRGELTRASQILVALRTIYPNDEQFRAAFADKSIKTTASRNAKVVRYILCRLEKQESGRDFDFDSASYTIEHVLPQNPQIGWEAFGDRDLETFIYRMANMVMLEAGKNKEIANRSYHDKQAVGGSPRITMTGLRTDWTRDSSSWQGWRRVCGVFPSFPEVPSAACPPGAEGCDRCCECRCRSRGWKSCGCDGRASRDAPGANGRVSDAIGRRRSRRAGARFAEGCIRQAGPCRWNPALDAVSHHTGDSRPRRGALPRRGWPALLARGHVEVQAGAAKVSGTAAARGPPVRGGRLSGCGAGRSAGRIRPGARP